MAPGHNFSPFPYHQLPRLSRREAAIASALARWIALRPLAARTAALVGGPVRVRLVGIARSAPDPHAAIAEVRTGGASIALAASSRPVRALARRLLGGPAELDAPRPLTVVEHAIWALAVAAALADLGGAAEVWTLIDAPSDPARVSVELTVELPPDLGPMTVTASVPADLLLRAPPARPLPAWS